MEPPETASPIDQKQQLRRKAYDARSDQTSKLSVSKLAIASFLELPEYQAAKTAMWYIDCRSELRTKQALPDALQSDKRIVVPYCTTDDDGQNKLGLWLLEDMEELVVGKWKILEPPSARWGEAGKEVSPQDLDIVMVPGVAFSRTGARMGNGQGYYDRLLQHARADCPLIGICYESQLFQELDSLVGAHDVFMDKIVTEANIYAGRGRG